MPLRRRIFIKLSGLAAAALALPLNGLRLHAAEQHFTLPDGTAPAPVPLPHFPDRLHAFIWRNWSLVPIGKLAAVLNATPEQIRGIGESMGLPPAPEISEDQWRRSCITIIRRNWHLLPYEQLLQLLGWSAGQMAYILREDDFLFVKLGSLKPKCSPLHYAPPAGQTRERAREIASLVRREFPDHGTTPADPLFGFVKELSSESAAAPSAANRVRGSDSPRFCYSYFGLYGDPLLQPECDPYPDGYLKKLAAIGMNGVWVQAVLHKLAPFSWIDENESERSQRLRNLRALAERASRHGIGIYLYLNEPRAMPLSFFEKHPDLKGVTEGGYAALCTSHPAVRESISRAIAHICREVPEIAGFFSITASENLTNCWSHGAGAQCPRCSKRAPAEVIAEVSSIFLHGIQQAKSKAALIAWDWGWRDEWAEEIIKRLPDSVALMSVSEWSIPIRRGGIDSVVGEYSISTIGPGPRAARHWELAAKRGLSRFAKIQAGNTWELSATPWIPAVANVATHVARLRKVGVDGLMCGWTLGGYPSPNLQTACEIAEMTELDLPVEEIVERTLMKVARERFGETLAGPVVAAWKEFSSAFSEFPFNGGLVYNAPMQFGPANLLWPQPTGYRATMIGFPYDDLAGWRQNYPVEVFIRQFDLIADGFDRAIARLQKELQGKSPSPDHSRAVQREIDVASAAAIHFRSTANQARFVQLRDLLTAAEKRDPVELEKLKQVLVDEMALARRLHEIQRRDSRIGFEATNHYYYVPLDLEEKVINCAWLLENWLPSLRK